MIDGVVRGAGVVLPQECGKAAAADTAMAAETAAGECDAAVGGRGGPA